MYRCISDATYVRVKSSWCDAVQTLAALMGDCASGALSVGRVEAQGRDGLAWLCGDTSSIESGIATNLVQKLRPNPPSQTTAYHNAPLRLVADRKP